MSRNHDTTEVFIPGKKLSFVFDNSMKWIIMIRNLSEVWRFDF